MFTFSTAINRINSQIEPIWDPSATSDQQFQAVNQALEYLWNFGNWDGIIQDVGGLATIGGILSLAPQYRFLTALRNIESGVNVSIKSQGFKYSPSMGQNTNGLAGYSSYQRGMMAFDLGDISAGISPYSVVQDTVTGDLFQVIVSNGIMGIQPAPPGSVPNLSIVTDSVTGQPFVLIVSNGILGIDTTSINPVSTNRQYQISGCSSDVDTLTFEGQATLRYIYATNLNQIIAPDNFPALLSAVRAGHFMDVGDENRAESHFQKALKLLETASAEIVEMEDMGSLSFDPMTSGGGMLNII